MSKIKTPNYIRGVGICEKGKPRSYYVVCPVCDNSDRNSAFYCDLCGKFIEFGENISCATINGVLVDSIRHFHTDCIKENELISQSREEVQNETM